MAVKIVQLRRPPPNTGGQGTPKTGVHVVQLGPVPNTAATRTLRKSVKAATAQVKAGKSPVKASTSDVLAKTAGPAPGELRRVATVKQKRAKLQAAGIDGGTLNKILNVAANAGGDVVHLPVTAVQGGYQVANATGQLFAGNTKPAADLVNSLRAHDPIYLGLDATAKKLQGDQAGAAHSAQKARDELKAHPGLAALEVVGGAGSLGKGVTRVQRLAGKEPTLRTPAMYPGSALGSGKRAYSDNAFHRGLQKRSYAKKLKAATDLRVRANNLEKHDAAANQTKVNEYRAKANDLDPNVMQDVQARTRAARGAGAQRALTTRNQMARAADVRKALQPLGRKSPKPTAAHTLAAQGMIDGSPTELAAYADKIRAGFSGLSDAEKASASATLKQIDKALAAKRAPADVVAGAKAYKAVADPLQAKLSDLGILPAERAAKAKLVPAAVNRIEGAKPGAKGPTLEGKPLTATEIAKHPDVAPVVEHTAYVAQRSARRGGPSTVLQEPRITGAPRTGRASAAGTLDASPQALPDTVRNTQRLLDLAHSYRSLVNESAAHENRHMTRADAQARANELQALHGRKYRIVPDDPFRGDETLASTLDEAAGEHSPAVQQTIATSVTDALSGKSEKPGTYSVLPDSFAQEHIDQVTPRAPTGAIGTTMKGISSMFRRTVLATSPTWFTGNAVEGALRAAFAGVRPGDKALLNNSLDELAKTDPIAAAEARDRIVHGGHYTSADRAQGSGLLPQYRGTHMAKPAAALQKFWAHPGPKAAADLWDEWTHIVFNQLSGRMESSIQSSMAGAALRKGGLIDRGLAKTSSEAVQQAARGLTNTNEQAALGEAVAQMYGRYDGFTADEKHFITTYTPFLAWTRNAAQFVLHVLPRDHPTAVALMVAQERATRDWRARHKLEDEPAWLKGSVPLPGGGQLRAIRYTPFGAFTSLTDTAKSLVLPQFSGVLAALNGEDWKGKKLYDKHGNAIGDKDKALKAMEAFAESTVPLYGRIKTIAAKGAGSLNPLAPVAPHPGGKGSSRSAGGGGSAADAGGIDFTGYGATGGGIDFTGYAPSP